MHEGVWSEDLGGAMAARLARRGVGRGGGIGAVAVVTFRAAPASAGVSCFDDSGCDGGDFCSVLGECISFGSCLGDADCSAGEVCFASSECGTPICLDDGGCGANEVCVDYTCEPDPSIECVNDLDCDQDETCDSGVCVPVPSECEVDSDCASSEVCDAGSCVVAGGGCAVDSDCDAGQVCVSGACVVDDGNPGGGTDGDCAPGDDACERANVTGLPDTGAVMAPAAGTGATIGVAALVTGLAWRLRRVATRG